jgi:hypothetical protein
MAAQTRVLRIRRREDGRFVIQGHSWEAPVGVDANLDMAIGSAVREATVISRDEHCRVLIQVERLNGSFKREQIINPPVHIQRNPRPAKPPA